MPHMIEIDLDGSPEKKVTVDMKSFRDVDEMM